MVVSLSLVPMASSHDSMLSDTLINLDSRRGRYDNTRTSVARACSGCGKWGSASGAAQAGQRKRASASGAAQVGQCRGTVQWGSAVGQRSGVWCGMGHLCWRQKQPRARKTRVSATLIGTIRAITQAKMSLAWGIPDFLPYLLSPLSPLSPLSRPEPFPDLWESCPP